MPILKMGKLQLTEVEWLAQSHMVPKRQTPSRIPFLLAHSACQPFTAARPSVICISLLPRFILRAPPSSCAISDRLPVMSLGCQSSGMAQN